MYGGVPVSTPRVAPSGRRVGRVLMSAVGCRCSVSTQRNVSWTGRAPMAVCVEACSPPLGSHLIDHGNVAPLRLGGVVAHGSVVFAALWKHWQPDMTVCRTVELVGGGSQGGLVHVRCGQCVCCPPPHARPRRQGAPGGLLAVV